jgi:predicted kinase
LLAERACLRSWRFFCFRREDRGPDYEALDDWHSEVTLLSGLPGSGKDTWLASNATDMPVISLDDLREELDAAPADLKGRLSPLRESKRIYLRERRPFTWNATNISRQLGSQLH